MNYLHLAEAGFIIVAPSKARGCLLPLQGFLYLLSCEEHLNVDQILKIEQRSKNASQTTRKRLKRLVHLSGYEIQNLQNEQETNGESCVEKMTSMPLCLASLTAVL